MRKLWMTGELPPEALAAIDRNAASDIFILEGRADLTEWEMGKLELAYTIQAWVAHELRERATK